MRSKLILITALSLGALLAPAALETPVAEALAQRKKKKKKKKGKTTKKAVVMGVIVEASGRRSKKVRSKEVKIIKIGFKEVQYQDGSNKRTVKGERVVDIEFSNAPVEYLTGRSQLRARRYARAAETFAKMKRARNAEAWVADYANFYLGEASRLNGDASAAVGHYSAFLKKNPDHLLSPGAYYGLGYAQVDAKKFSDAISSFQKLDKFGQEWAAKGLLGQGDANLKSKNYDGARKAYNRAEGKARDDTIRLMAKVGTGNTLIAKKSYERALEEFENRILRGRCPPTVAAWAWVGVGDVHWARAEEESKKDKKKDHFKSALVAYLTCTTRFAGNHDAYPKALYRAMRCYEKFNQTKKAEALRAELMNSCPNSKWAKQINK